MQVVQYGAERERQTTEGGQEVEHVSSGHAHLHSGSQGEVEAARVFVGFVLRAVKRIIVIANHYLGNLNRALVVVRHVAKQGGYIQCFELCL